MASEAAGSRTYRMQLQEFDGSVSWSAYRAQFELILVNNGWEDVEKAAYLAGSLKGPAQTSRVFIA